MAKTIDELKAQSAEVKNATVVGENTATRVGTLFNDIVEYIEQVSADGAVTTEKLAPQAVTTEKLADSAISKAMTTAITDEKSRAEGAEKILNNELTDISKKVGSADTEITLTEQTGLIAINGVFKDTSGYGNRWDGFILDLSTGDYQLGEGVSGAYLCAERPAINTTYNSTKAYAKGDILSATSNEKYAFVYINKNTTQTCIVIKKSTGLVEQVDNLTKEVTEVKEVTTGIKTGTIIKEYVNNATCNKVIKELYINNPNNEELFVVLVSKERLLIKNSEGNVLSCGYGETIAQNVIVKLHPSAETSLYGYVIINDVTDTISSSAGYKINDCSYNIVYSPTIQGSIIKKDVGNIKGTNAWCSRDDINNHISELFIDTSVLGTNLSISKFNCDTQQIRLFIKNNDTEEVVATTSRNFYANAGETNVDGSYRDYYDSHAISCIYTTIDANSERQKVVGYIIFNHVSDLNISGTFAINNNFVSDLSYCPSIKKMLDDDRQIVIVGDSHPSYPRIANIFADILRGRTGIKVWNCTFGGCRMSWRTDNGSDKYDVYTLPNIVDAIVSGDFTSQIAGIKATGQSYHPQVAELEMIDTTKPIEFIIEYGGNDYNSGSQIGSVYQDDGVFDITKTEDVTNKLASFDRTTLLGALNYGLVKMFANYPKTLNVQVTGMAWVIFDTPDNEGHRTRTTRKNDLGNTIVDYNNALKENCLETGIAYANYDNCGIYNAFAMRFDGGTGSGITIDGSMHNEPIGFAKMATWWINMIRNHYSF